MQKILEQRGSPMGQNKAKLQVSLVLACVSVAGYLALVVLPGVNPPTIGEVNDTDTPSRPTAKVVAGPKGSELKLTEVNAPPATMAPTSPKISRDGHRRQHDDTEPASSDGTTDLLPTWGYNRERNRRRFRGILDSIREDDPTHQGRFTLVDYGSDQGYFSVSIAHFFPHAFVMSVERGGVGGIIWEKKKLDVLRIQEAMAQKYHLTNFAICETSVLVEHFTQLRDAKAASDYQFVLSVFHWFNLTTRTSFEQAVVNLFLNARTTFIELPTIGDNSQLIRNQVGYANFAKWYDGRTDVGQILREAAREQGVAVQVRMVASVKWLRWTREVYRVDIKAGDAKAVAPTVQSFQCDTRRKLYNCAKRTLHQQCPTE